MAVPAGEWLALVEREYLDKFIPFGGTAIKFVTGEPDLLARTRDALEAAARARNLDWIALDAATTRIHMIQDVFYAIARHVDWDSLAQRWIEEAFCEHYYDWPRPGEAVAMRELAEANEVAETLLSRDVRKWLTADIMRDRELAQDFRAAMVQLCLHRMEPEDERADLPVVEWLRGELRAMGALKGAQINQRITRHNGRAMLKSLCRWLRLSGGQGLAVALDLGQIAYAGPVFGEARRYTPAAVLDVFEVLRQLIDDAESFEGLFVTVFCDPGFIDGDPKRSVSAYPALKERIWADVHAERHENALAPLLQLADGPTRRSGNGAAEAGLSPERVAIEALRAGVPNRAAVRLLGTAEGALGSRFAAKLTACRIGSSRPIEGEIVAGGFGAGKSHLITFLAEQALAENFIVSTVAISKETPLFDPERLFAAAARNAVVPGMNDDVMTAVIARLEPQSPAWEEFSAWAASPAARLSPVFPALLHLIPRMAPEDLAAIGRFLAGGKLSFVRIRQWLRAAGAAKLFELKPLKAADLAQQRLRFAPRLFRAAGFSGWCVLIDEVELIGRYSTLQRARSYTELSRWLGLAGDVGLQGVVTVAAITDDFKAAILEGKLDLDKAPRLLIGKGQERQAELAKAAMAAIERRQHLLKRPDEAQLAASLEAVGALYRQAYGWAPPEIGIGERRAGGTMRQYIKSWITEWDLLRLTGEKAGIEVETLEADYSENPDLEAAPAEEQELQEE